MKSKCKVKPDNLYLLSMLDIIDRLDILLLEIRHIQQTIIHLLRTPTLYLPQRYEEKYIFGGWENISKNHIKPSDRNTDTILTNLCIIRYPSPKYAVTRSKKPTQKNSSKSTAKKPEIIEKLYQRVAQIWISDIWAEGQRRHYHALRALQILKMQVFRDKLTVYREVEGSGLVSGDRKNNGISYPAMLVLFDAIKQKISKTYITILRTHQQNLSKSLSYGLQDYPRPLIERRRNIGIFADFLSERTHDIQKDMLHLISHFHSDKEANNHEHINKAVPLILHGWSLYPYSSNMQLFDNVGRNSKNNRIEDVNYVDSSFWSPDRPDLQPLIAYEVGNLCVCHVFKNLSDNYVSNTNSDLTRLISELFYAINSFTQRMPELQPIQDNIRSLLRKILSDFLAATVKGISYVYALFLSLVGQDMGSLLLHQTVIHLERVTELDSGIDSINNYYQWYFRLKLCAFWMKQVMHTPTNQLDEIVLDGVSKVCDDLIGFLDSSTPSSRNRVGVMWKKLEIELENIINHSPLVMSARNWRSQRSCDNWDEEKKCSGKKEFFRSTIRLDLRLQNYLFREVLNDKLNRTDNADQQPKTQMEMIEYFQAKYGLGCEEIPVPNDSSKSLEQPRWLFRHLYDIPFQCATMRSIDILEQRSHNHYSKGDYSWQEFIKTTHNDISLGRELFSLALEFYTWGRESARNRLLLCVNLITFSLYECKKEFKQQLKIWIKGQSPDDVLLQKIYAKYTLPENERNIPQLINKITTLSYRKVQGLFLEKEKLTEKYLQYMGATDIVNAFSIDAENEGNQERRLEQIAGYKLHHLYLILDEFKKHQDFPETFQAAIEYLLIHSDFETEYNKDSDTHASSRFYSLLLSALGDGYNYEQTQQQLAKTDLPKRPPFVMVSYISMTNYYPVADPLDPTKHPQQKDQGDQREWNPNGLSLKQGMALGAWKGYEAQKNQFFPTLGQYDAIGFLNVKLPCKCRIPSFEKNKTQPDKLADTFRTADEKFVTHFSLREIAIPIQITKKNIDETGIGYLDNEVVAIIAISLQRRSMRLNLICRILQAMKDANAQAVHRTNGKNKRRTLESKLAEFYTCVPASMNIHALLTDGWGDVLLIFSKQPHDHENMDNFADYIFALQEVLYEDFMVDRTEITFMPKCLDEIMYNENYGIRVSLRFMEDRRLEKSLSKYLKAYTDAKNESADTDTLEAVILDESTIVRVPGRMDFLIQIDALEKAERREDFHQVLLNVLANLKKGLNPWFPDELGMLSKVETVIEVKHNKFNSC